MFINEKLFENDFLTTKVIIIKVYLINDLKINILINTNIITSQKLCINFNKRVFIINTCQDIETFLKIVL